MIKYNFSLIVVILIFCGGKMEAQQVTKSGQESSKIKWAIKPFLEAKTIEDYNAEYGQIIFTQGNYDVREDKWGVADRKGTILIEAKYRRIHGSKHGLQYTTWNEKSYAARRKTPKAFENWEKLLYLSFEDEIIERSGYILSKFDNNTFLIKNKAGNTIRELKTQWAWTKNGWIIYDNNGKYGVLNRVGEESIPFGKFEWIGRFENGKSTQARFIRGEDVLVIDTVGNVLNSFEGMDLYEQGGNQGYFKSVKDGRWGIVDSKGKVLIEPGYEHIRLSTENISLFVGMKMQDGLMSIYNFKEENLFSEVFNFADIMGKYALTESREKKILNIYSIPDLKLIRTFELKEWQTINNFSKDEKTGRIFLAFSTGLYGKFFHPMDGAPLLDEKTRDHQLLYGCIKYYQDGKYGIISTIGIPLVLPIFEDVTFLSDSQTFWAKQDGKWGLLKIKP